MDSSGPGSEGFDIDQDMLSVMRITLSGLLLLTACRGNDYGVAKDADPNPGAGRPVDLVVDVAFQSQNQGESVTRCQVQVAFKPLLEQDPQQTRSSRDLNRPEEPGTCAFSEIPLPQGAPGDEVVDNWQVTGEVIGPDTVRMQDAEGALALMALRTEEGDLRYELPDCDASIFPFSRTLGLDVPDSDDPDGVHAFTVPDLVAVGPQVALDAPGRTAEGRQPTLDPSEPLAVRWTLQGPDPQLDGMALEPATMIQVQHQDEARVEPDRWLVCWPEEEGWFDVPAEDLALLMEGRDDPSGWRSHVDVHTEVLGPSQVTPWGRTLQVRAHVSAGAGIDLDPSGDATR